MEKTYNIFLDNNKKSNEFLRCLWSQIRNKFGKLAWNISPMKIGEIQTIHIGYADMGNVTNDHQPTSISCTYSKKGCLKTLTWKNDKLTNPSQFEQKFDDCVKEAMNWDGYKKIFFLQHKLDKSISFKSYEGKNFTLDGNLLSFKIKAYDAEECKTFAQNTAKIIRSFLTFDTLKFISSSNSGIEILRSMTDETFVLINEDTGEETSSMSKNEKFKNLEVSKEIINQIEIFLEKESDYENSYTLFEKSIMTFSQAILFEEMADSPFYLDFSPSEYAIISYMSAMEIITLKDIPPTKCNECNQDKYSIARRVISLSEQATNNNYLKGLISRFYSVRSKFVHSGEYLSSNNYTGLSIPLLSSTELNGIITQKFYFDSVMKELVKECIIWHEKKQ